MGARPRRRRGDHDHDPIAGTTERPSRPLSTVDRTPNGAAWRAHTDGNWAPRGGTLAAVWERASQGRKVTRAGTTVFGAGTSAEGRPLWDRRAKAVGISLWGSPRWLQFREMAGDGGTSRVSGTERPEPMTSTDNRRPSEPSRSRIPRGRVGSRSREGSSRAVWASNEAQGRYRLDGWCLSSCVFHTLLQRGVSVGRPSHPICPREP